MSPLALSLRFLQTQPDSRLVELSRAGHERAFEALVQRYRRQLLAYCRRITTSEASAEDALQQALLQAWVALSTSEAEVRDARAWLYRIVHNVAISNLRRTVPDAVEVDDAQPVLGADYEVERRLAVREALAGLASLPELQRRVMLSTALEGRSHDEIATALGLSHGAVRGLIYRARATLRAAAAVVTPAPLVQWAVRQQGPGAGRSAGLVEAIAAGGGGAGLGGVLLKGGVLVVSAGAIATAAGITSTHARNQAPHHRPVVAARHSGPGASAAVRGAPAGAATAVAVSTIKLASAGTSQRRGSARSAHDGSSRSSSARGGSQVLFGGSSHDHSGGRGPSSGDGQQAGSGPGGGGGRRSGGGDSGHGSGSGGGSGGDQHGGHDGSHTGSATSGDGGSGGDHGGGEGGTLSSTMTVTSTSGGAGDGRGDGSGGDGGGDRTGGTTTASTTTTMTTTTSTTTSGSATSGN